MKTDAVLRHRSVFVSVRGVASSYNQRAYSTVHSAVIDHRDKCYEAALVMGSEAAYKGFKPASPTASRAARGSSRKRDTKAEIILRRALWSLGLRYRVDVTDITGRPDIVFVAARVAVFVDGDFWHGRDLEARLERLQRGHNAPYWIKKISGNVARDRRNETTLVELGWIVLRYWETDIRKDAAGIANVVASVVRSRAQAA